MPDPSPIKDIKLSISIPVMAKSRVGHFVEAQIRNRCVEEAIGGLFLRNKQGFARLSETRAEIVEIITQLEAKNPTPAPTEALPRPY
ncbi:prolyl aminopeptidase [Castilleja foliolosa]|uniref:Prolyl aminopeptidase n=1 Tax=Castilleja foliolosa TaxID=1961234 RepID=A0ABD3DBQ8_9LAMI